MGRGLILLGLLALAVVGFQSGGRQTAHDWPIARAYRAAQNCQASGAPSVCVKHGAVITQYVAPAPRHNRPEITLTLDTNQSETVNVNAPDDPSPLPVNAHVAVRVFDGYTVAVQGTDGSWYGTDQTPLDPLYSDGFQFGLGAAILVIVVAYWRPLERAIPYRVRPYRKQVLWALLFLPLIGLVVLSIIFDLVGGTGIEARDVIGLLLGILFAIYPTMLCVSGLDVGPDAVVPRSFGRRGSPIPYNEVTKMRISGWRSRLPPSYRIYWTLNNQPREVVTDCPGDPAAPFGRARWQLETLIQLVTTANPTVVLDERLETYRMKSPAVDSSQH